MLVDAMDYRSDSETESDNTLTDVSNSKLMGENYSCVELGESADRAVKRFLCLEAIANSEGIDTHYPKKFRTMDVGNESDFVEGEMSQATKDSLQNSTVVQVPRTLSLFVDGALRTRELDTQVSNAKSLVPCDTIGGEGYSRLRVLEKDDRKKEVSSVNSRGLSFDLNLEDIPDNNNAHLKSSDTSECGSTSVLLQKKDPLKIWKEMKENGFLSTSYSAAAPEPKQCPKKTKKNGMKKKMEIAKKEQVDKFVRMATPSGLLNRLNPGIITNVRNMKQVHSIIQGLTRPEVVEKSQLESIHAHKLNNGSEEFLSQQAKSHNTHIGSKHTSGYLMPCNKPTSMKWKERCGDAESCMVDRNNNSRTTCDYSITDHKEDVSAMKLPASTAKSLGEVSATSTKDKQSSVSSLSMKAATVASEWLGLLIEDINGRLAALRRSKKRVRDVIDTELNCLLSKEFSSNQENNQCSAHIYASGHSRKTIADLHQARWSRLFDQMDKMLSEEEKLLNDWLKQVLELQLHCESGLQDNHLNASSFFQLPGLSEECTRSEKLDKSERELAVRAAAASIYSTCNYLLSKENVQCF